MSLINRIKRIFKAKKEEAKEIPFDPETLTQELENEILHLSQTIREHDRTKDLANQNLAKVRGQIKQKEDELVSYTKLSEAQGKELEKLLKQEKDVTKHPEIISDFEKRGEPVLDKIVRFQNQLTQLKQQEKSFKLQHEQIKIRLANLNKILIASKEKMEDFHQKVATIQAQQQVAELSETFSEANMDEFNDKLLQVSSMLDAKTELFESSNPEDGIEDILSELQDSVAQKAISSTD